MLEVSEDRGTVPAMGVVCTSVGVVREPKALAILRFFLQGPRDHDSPIHLPDLVPEDIY